MLQGRQAAQARRLSFNYMIYTFSSEYIPPHKRG